MYLIPLIWWYAFHLWELQKQTVIIAIFAALWVQLLFLGRTNINFDNFLTYFIEIQRDAFMWKPCQRREMNCAKAFNCLYLKLIFTKLTSVKANPKIYSTASCLSALQL